MRIVVLAFLSRLHLFLVKTRLEESMTLISFNARRDVPPADRKYYIYLEWM